MYQCCNLNSLLIYLYIHDVICLPFVVYLFHLFDQIFVYVYARIEKNTMLKNFRETGN